MPAPGGTQCVDEGLSVTKSEDFLATVNLTREAFAQQGLDEAWARVIAVVVQPGVEFGDHSIHEYNREQARELTSQLAQYPDLVL